MKFIKTCQDFIKINENRAQYSYNEILKEGSYIWPHILHIQWHTSYGKVITFAEILIKLEIHTTKYII